MCSFLKSCYCGCTLPEISKLVLELRDPITKFVIGFIVKELFLSDQVTKNKDFPYISLKLREENSKFCKNSTYSHSLVEL